MRSRHVRVVITAIALAVGAVVSHVYAAVGSQCSGQDCSAARSEVHRPQVLESYGKLPLSFEANQGQANLAVDFISQGYGYTLLLTGNEATLGLKPRVAAQQSSVVRMR